MFLSGSFLGHLLLIAGMSAATFLIFAYGAQPNERWLKGRAEKADTLKNRISKLWGTQAGRPVNRGHQIFV